MSTTNYSQDNRIIGVTGSQWKGFYLKEISGQERLGALYCYEAILHAGISSAEVSALPGKAIAVHISFTKNRGRYIHGIVTSAKVILETDNGRPGVIICARIEPTLALLKSSAQFRVFQNKSVPEVVNDIMKARGVPVFKQKVKSACQPHPFLMQYQESDFDFISRLLAKEGLYYFFEHEREAHTAVLTDSDLMHPESQAGTFPWRERKEGDCGEVFHWQACYSLQPSEVMISGVDPVQSCCKPASARVASPGGQETEWGLAAGEAGHETVSRLAQDQAGYHAFQRQFFTGVSDDLSLVCGERFSLTGHPGDSGEYYLTGLEMRIVSNVAHQSPGVESVFVAQKKGVPFRQAVLPPVRPVPGLLRARVVGPASEAVHTDKEGRVRVRFLWDREGKDDGSQACWLRVMQPWSGNGLGAQFIPRVGSEVMVGFWMGDPDDPVITGMLYSGPDLPPFSLPGKKALSGFVTRSFSGEKESGHQLSFDDTKGKEVFLLHSQKDMKINVKHDLSTGVENNSTLITGGDHHIEIKKGHYSMEIQSGNGDVSVKGNMVTAIKTGNYQLTVDGGKCVISANKGCELSSPTGITLKVGDSKLSLTPKGITLSGPQVDIKGLGKLSVKGAMVNVEGEAATTLKGAVVTVEGKGATNVKGAVVSVQGSGITTVKGAVTMIG
ncbi:type VI secretion system tip protein VgrG [Salmonella enterica]